MRLYLKLPIIDPVENDSQGSSYSQDSYIIWEDYIFYVIRQGDKELILLYQKDLNIEEVADISLEFYEFLETKFRKNYVFTVSANT